MLVKELLEQVDAMVPNSITIPLKLTWMTHVQNQLYRDYPTPDSVYLFDTVVGLNVYTFPDDCLEDRVGQVVIGDEEYTFIPLTESVEVDGMNFWTIANGSLVIHPTPTTVQDGFIFYRPRPVALTVAQLDQQATFPVDFQELLVIGCASRIAKATNQLQLANVFDADFIRLADQADRKIIKKRQNSVVILRGWS